MINKIEFSDAKQVRKTLLIVSFIGVSFESLVEHSTGNIEFLGFKIPADNATVIPNFIGYLIIYLLIALIIRYSDNDLRTKYKNFIEYHKLKTAGERQNFEKAQSILRDNNIGRKAIRIGLISIDIIFPIIFGLFVLYKIFLC